MYFSDEEYFANKFLEVVTTFANTCDGTVVLKCSADVTHEDYGDYRFILQQVASLLKTRVVPNVDFELSVDKQADNIEILVNVRKGVNPPYCYLHVTEDGKPSVRYQMLTYNLTEEDLLELPYFASKLTPTSHKVADYSFNNLRKALGHELTHADLHDLGLVNADHELTDDGLLFVDDLPQGLPQVICRKLKGKLKDLGKVEIEEEVFIQGDVPSLLVKSLQETQNLIAKSPTKSIYPESAIREALINALAHRDYTYEGIAIVIDVYEDALEIWSPGDDLAEIHLSDFSIIMARQRNPYVSEILAKLQLMNKEGSGISRILADYQSHPNYTEKHRPEFHSSHLAFCVTLHNLA